jgi:hypothetical protein
LCRSHGPAHRPRDSKAAAATIAAQMNRAVISLLPDFSLQT